MPTRPNRRQIREQEELNALHDAVDDTTENQSESEPGSPVVSSKPLVGGFAALMETHEEDGSESENDTTQARSSKAKKKKKKKKAAATTPAALSSAPEDRPFERNDGAEPAASSPSPPAGSSKKEKKAIKKQKAKDRHKDGMIDDVDKALAEMSLKYPELRQQPTSHLPASSPATARSLAALLAVSLPHLDSEAELRKFFGSKVISAAKGGSSSTQGRQSAAQRSNLTRPQSTWWPAQFREGLSVRLLAPEEVGEGLRSHQRQPLHGEKLWTVEYSKKYRLATFDFMRTVLSGDPVGFQQVLRDLPYHADTLLQMSEVYHHREEHSTAADFVDRSLFAYERAFVGAFNFTGANRLDFDHVENRPFFLALHRQITDLQRRGCIRTSFEFARLLYGLDPWTDPHGSLLHLDFLAIKTGMTQWLIDLWDLFQPELDREGKDTKSPYVRRLLPNLLPGFAYSRALALYIREVADSDNVHERSTEALEHAIRTFPSVVPLLADKADISLGGDIRGHPAFRIQTDNSMLVSDSQIILHLLSHLYAQRSASFWKPQARAAWFAKAVSELLPSLPSSSPAAPRPFTARFDAPSLAYSVYRHVLVNEPTCRSLFPFLPRAILDKRHLACDPLPPSTSANEYNAEFFRGVEEIRAAHPRSRRQEARRLERLVPDAAFRAQLVGFWEAHPAVRQRFPGGVGQFAEWAGQMPEDALEDLFIALVEVEQLQQRQREGDMPGGMPGEDVMVNFVDPEDVEDGPQPAQAQAARPEAEDEEEEDEDDDEEQEVAPLPVRILRSVIGRFWGGGASNNANEGSSDEEEDQLRDIEGVD